MILITLKSFPFVHNQQSTPLSIYHMIVLCFIFHLAASIQILAVSNSSIKLLAPLPNDPIQKVKNVYSKVLTNAPEAYWIWSGPGDNKNCSQTIELEVSFNITCLTQPITLSGMSDNQGHATFMGQIYKSMFYDKLTTISASPTGQTCNQNYTFSITAKNDIQGPNGCRDGVAGIIFAITQPDCCAATHYADPSTCLCQPCPIPMPGCLTCSSSSSCLACDPNGYYLNSSLCYVCSDVIPGCINCSNSTKCLVCDTANGYTVKGDTCYKEPSIKMFVFHVVKEPYQNNVTIVIGIRPLDENLHYLNFNEAVIFTQNFTNLSTSYDPNGTLLVNFIYHRTYEGQEIRLTISPSLSSNASFKSYGSLNLDVTMTTNSNIPITHYTQDQYKIAIIIQKAYTILTVLCCILILLGFFVNKIIGLEMMGVLQAAHLAVSNIVKINPAMYYLSLMNQVNGYNYFQGTDNRQLPEKLNALKDSSNISWNFNVMLIVIYLPLAIGGILFFIYFIIQRVNRRWKWNQKLKMISLHCLKEYSLAVNLFCSMNIGFSIGIQLSFGETTTINVLMCILLLLPLVANAFSLVHSNDSEFGEFKKEFKRNFEGDRYFNISIIYRVVVGLILGLLSSFDIGCIFPFFLTFAYLIYLLTNIPYRRGVHNYRTIIVHLAILLVFGNTMYYRSMRTNHPIVTTTQILAPGYAQIVVISLAFLVSLGVFIYDLKQKSLKFWRGYKKSKQTPSQNTRKMTDERAVFIEHVTQQVIVD